jgi:flagellar biosynthesis protein FlhF
MTSSAPKSPAPGTYRFIVRSVNEALSVLKAQLGPEARVLSVRPVRQNFLKRIFGGAKLEVIAELAAPESVLEPVMAPPVPGVLNSTYAVGLAHGGRPVDLRTALRAAGFSESLLWRVETERRWSISGDKPLGDAQAEFVHELRQLVGAFPVVPLSRRVVFISSSQADKSLALGQWLTWEVFQQGTKCRVHHVEFSRPNPCLELEVFCDAVGVGLTHHTPNLRVSDEGARVYWDVPCFGAAAGDEMPLLADLLEQQAIETRVLVLNAAYETESLRAGLKSGRALGATHVVLTHLDEAKDVGKIWETLLEAEMRPLFFSHNGNLLGPIGADPLDFLARKTLGKS